MLVLEDVVHKIHNKFSQLPDGIHASHATRRIDGPGRRGLSRMQARQLLYEHCQNWSICPHLIRLYMINRPNSALELASKSPGRFSQISA